MRHQGPDPLVMVRSLPSQITRAGWSASRPRSPRPQDRHPGTANNQLLVVEYMVRRSPPKSHTPARISSGLDPQTRPGCTLGACGERPYNSRGISPREVRHERQKLFPPCRVALCHHRRGAIHPCRGRMANSGQRDDLSSSLAKLDCLRGYRWAGVGRFRRISPGLSLEGRVRKGPPLS